MHNNSLSLYSVHVYDSEIKRKYLLLLLLLLLLLPLIEMSRLIKMN